MIIDVDNSAAAADEDDDHDDDDDDDDDDDAFQGGVREAFFSNEYYSLVYFLIPISKFANGITRS